MSLFIIRRGPDMVYLLLYIDDIILTVSSSEHLHHTIAALQWEFAMKDLRPLHHFLGITIEHHSDGLFLHQCTYTLDVIKRAAMADCKSCTTPVDLQVKHAADFRATCPRCLPVLEHRRRLAIPDVHSTRQCLRRIVDCLHMHDPREPHLTAMKRILRYLQRTPYYGLLLCRSSCSDLIVYTDADWARCPDTRRSASWYTVFLRDNLVSWSAKHRQSSLGPVQKLSTALSPTAWLRPPGCASYSISICP
jgi:hypothetical protein